VVQQPRQEGLQLAAAEVRDDLIPLRRRLGLMHPAQVGLELACEDPQRGRLTDAVRPDQPEHLPRPWRWHPVGDGRSQLVRQVDDTHCAAGTAPGLVEAALAHIVEHRATVLPRHANAQLIALPLAGQLAQVVVGRHARLTFALVEQHEARQVVSQVGVQVGRRANHVRRGTAGAQSRGDARR
jgi:hypothetical protein